ncbi:hypothetical protein [Hydrogenophaga sp.]|uniref:hypothetical protein n=1 Tax=Hydrogenophaga sp. TaxID=1904254 RepID=UPI00260F280F|nr:hypothetical protein [Hydrogenophaga sp.]
MTDRSFSAFCGAEHGGFFMGNRKGAAMLDEVEKQLLQQFEEQGRRTVLVHEAVLGDVLTRVSMQRNRHGEPVFRYWFGESRVDRRTFQTLTCTETRCPQHQSVMQKWLVHIGMIKPIRPIRSEPFGQCSLAAEEHIQLGHQVFTAREARFPVSLTCKHMAHAPLRISVKGWDVFGEEGYLAGGWAKDAPMFETLEQVKAWLQAQSSISTLTPSAI